MSAAGFMEDLRAKGVRIARVSHCDLFGKCRSKDLPIADLAQAAEGLGYCVVSMIEDIRGNPLMEAGFAGDSGFPDMRAVADLSTARIMPWDPEAVWLLADLHEDRGLAPRSALVRAVEALAAAGLEAIVAPELEFYLLRGDGRYGDAEGLAYTTGARADPDGAFRRIHRDLDAFGIGVTAAHHEFSPGQFEINLRHGPALETADRGFLFKEAVRELAAREGLRANFMAKPFTDAEGNSLHVHVSLLREGRNAFDGVNETCLAFVAGVLAHAPALTALASPTTNSYRRLVPDAMAPRTADWGLDHRFTYVRIPPERGAATRVEVRAGDASANPYLVYAATLHAGLDGIRRELQPPEPQPPAELAGAGAALPLRLEDALDALQADEALVDALGPELVRTFVALKRTEVERSRAAVTDWEWNEYAWHA